MNIKYLLTLFFMPLAIFGSQDPNRTLNDFQKELIQRYKVPSHIKDLLKVRGVPAKPVEFLNGYYIKPNGYSRILGKDYFDTIIKKHNLNLLFTPEKYIYHVPGTPKSVESSDRYNFNYYVLAKKVAIQRQEPKKNNQLFNIIPDHWLSHYHQYTLPEAQQLCDFAEKSRYGDLSMNNIGYVNGKICIIDTEARICGPGQFGKLAALRHLANNVEWTPEARRYVVQRRKDREDKYAISEWFENTLHKQDPQLYLAYLRDLREKLIAFDSKFRVK